MIVSSRPVNNLPQQQQLIAQSQQTRKQQPQNANIQAQGGGITRRRGPGIIGRGMLPLSDGLPIQEYERRRQHNSHQAEENKKEQRERNNEAARRSRQRRADLISTQTAEIQRLSQEVGALTRERDYWKGVVERMQGGGGSGGGTQQQQPLSSSQYLAYPAAMTPSAAPLGHASVAPAAPMQTPQFSGIATPSQLPNHVTPSQMLSQYPELASMPPQRLQAQAGQNRQSSAPVSQTIAPAAFDNDSRPQVESDSFTGFDFLQSSNTYTPDATTTSGAVGSLDDSVLLMQLEEYENQMKNGDALDHTEDFDVTLGQSS